MGYIDVYEPVYVVSIEGTRLDGQLQEVCGEEWASDE